MWSQPSRPVTVNDFCSSGTIIHFIKCSFPTYRISLSFLLNLLSKRTISPLKSDLFKKILLCFVQALLSRFSGIRVFFIRLRKYKGLYDDFSSLFSSIYILAIKIFCFAFSFKHLCGKYFLHRCNLSMEDFSDDIFDSQYAHSFWQALTSYVIAFRRTHL